MVTSPYQSKVLAHLLTLRHPSNSPDKLAGTLVDARVDLNPHQVEAALFAFNSPFSKGAILADEVGLGKTIEAGLVIAQKWAERKRRILIITPANLRKQWNQELLEKFFLQSTLLEAKSYNEAIKRGDFSPFESTGDIVICSYQFARGKAADIARIPWDLVVIDEAHRLRNVYKPGNVIANTLKMALKSAPKLLLTATPLQNSLLELYGLVSIIDDHAFGDLQSFREQYARLNDETTFEILKARLKPLCKRTLRRQVTQYINYTKRHPLVEQFTPEESEDRLYHLVSEYLQRENLVALPMAQRGLITLVLRKLLASSTFAIAGALETMVRRLEAKLARNQVPPVSLTEELDADYEGLRETAEEWTDTLDDEVPLTPQEIEALQAEIAELKRFAELASSIEDNAKGKALIQGLSRAFEEADRLGAIRKAIIFTESRKTQDYLLRLLESHGFQDQIVLFNGTNTDPRSRALYSKWVARNQGSDRITGSRTADMRSAIVDEFRERAPIMIATEAGAEGINLQFCSLVVNYDLPWNPQRIEQRIGRCHRYGQKHDVVVVNFVNVNNQADVRVFELLSEKFKLFEGVFGASDEVLGAIESGVDFERRIADIYQECRTNEEIVESFEKLQLELNFEIETELKKTRTQLLENFDQEVTEKLKATKLKNEENLGRYEQMLLDLTRFELRRDASFGEGTAFDLTAQPLGTRVEDVPLGRYELPRKSDHAHHYRVGHPLAQHLITEAKNRDLPPAELTFDYSGTPGKVALLDGLVGKSGQMTLSLLTIETLDQAEDHLIVAAVTDDGEELPSDAVQRLLGFPVASATPLLGLAEEGMLAEIAARNEGAIRLEISERNAQFFDAEARKLDDWAEDLKVGLERDIKELDRQIREAKRAAAGSGSLEAKLDGQKQVRKLEGDRSAKRRALFEAQDEIDAQRTKLIEDLESKLAEQSVKTNLLTARFFVK